MQILTDIEDHRKTKIRQDKKVRLISRHTKKSEAKTKGGEKTRTHRNEKIPNTKRKRAHKDNIARTHIEKRRSPKTKTNESTQRQRRKQLEKTKDEEQKGIDEKQKGIDKGHKKTRNYNEATSSTCS